MTQKLEYSDKNVREAVIKMLQITITKKFETNEKTKQNKTLVSANPPKDIKHKMEILQLK